MADKIVQVTALKLTASAVEYTPKIVTLPVSPIIAGSAQPVRITTTVDSPRITGVVTNMGEESIPNPHLFKRLNDRYTNTDVVSLRYLQTKLDQTLALDLFSRVVEYNRVFQEAQTTADSYKVFFVNKGLVDYSTAIDAPTIIFTKPLQDQGTLLDVPVLTVAKPIFSQVTYSQEVIKAAYLKVASDLVVNAEDFRRQVDYVRGFHSIADATDDFFGESNVDDDQIARVGKTLVNWVASTEVRSVYVVKVLINQTAIAEQKTVSLTKPLVSQSILGSQAYLSFSKPLVSASTLADQYKYQADKTLLNTFVTADQHISKTSKLFINLTETADQKFFNLQKPLVSVAINSDTVIKTWLAQKQFTNQTATNTLISFEFDQQLVHVFGATEQTRKNLGKTLLSGFVLADQLSSQVNYKRNFTDFAASTDDFFGNANADDDQIARVGKNIISWLLPTTQHSIVSSKVLNTQYSVGEQARRQAFKVLSSTFSNTDLIAYKVDKTLLTNLTSSVERVAKRIQTVKQDLVLLPDQVRKQPTKVLVTGFLQQDLVQKTPKKVLLSQATASDIISFFKFGNRFFQEIITTNDSGVINNQGYFAESYVEPGYAGTNTNFS